MAFRLSLKGVFTFPIADAPITILSNFANAVAKLISKVSTLFTSFETFQMQEYVKKSQDIQRQVLGIFLPQQEEYYSRLSLRLALGLPPVFEEDPEAIRSLEGVISNITKEKIDVTGIIRNMRDNR